MSYLQRNLGSGIGHGSNLFGVIPLRAFKFIGSILLVVVVVFAFKLFVLILAVQGGGDQVRTTIKLGSTLSDQRHQELERALQDDLGLSCRKIAEDSRCSSWEGGPPANYFWLETKDREGHSLIFVRSLPRRTFLFFPRVGSFHLDAEAHLLELLGSDVNWAQRYAMLAGVEEIRQLRGRQQS